ncbi:MAG: hypothetical protein II667_03500 [Clostridiales bacterium]|nr:hypothetical protein [Clostridiales bacterium]
MNKLGLRRKAAAVLLSAVLSISAVMTAGCGISQAKDEAMLQDLSARFIEAVKSGDEDEIEELTGKEYSYTFKDESKAGIVMQMASKTEIEEYKSIQIDREHNKAKVRLKLSYFSLNDFVRDEGYMMTEEEYTEKIDAYETRVTDYYSISFKLSEDGSWIIDDSAVTRLMSKFDRPYYIQIASISAADAEAAAEGLFAGLAEGVFDQEYYTLDLAEMRVFDDGMYNSDLLDEAVGEFTKAYAGYIVDNGMTCEPEDSYGIDYMYSITGKAPSSDEILAYLSSDERVIEAYMATIRIESGCSYMTEDEIWSSMYAEIYFDLAKKIPDMDGEDYYQTVYVDPTANDPEIVLGWNILPFTYYDMVGAGAISDEQAQECYIQAVTNLYLAGELTEEQYNEYLDTADDNGEGSGSFQNEVGFIEWPGTEDHPNQAVLVYEYIPDWSDGTLIYGASDTDENGIYMHYSKEPGWLNTAGYCIDDDGITIMVTFDKSFTMGTVLEYDWELGDEDYGETEQFTVQENGQNTFEFTLPIDSIPYDGGVEFRLWEEGHSHVIAYVYLIQT